MNEATIRQWYDISYMQNFSTFLNNVPDPETVAEPSIEPSIQQGQVLIIDGQEYR